MRNKALDFIRSDFYKGSRYKPLAWPMLAICLIFCWEREIPARKEK